MIALQIQDDAGGPPETVRYEKDEVSIGRVTGNDLVLANATVSSRHARLSRENGSWFVRDVGSTNGTFVNGHRIDSLVPLREGDELGVGQFRIRLASGEVAPGKPAPAVSPQAPPLDPALELESRKLKEKVHKKLIEFLDLRWVDLSKMKEAEIHAQTRAAVENILREIAWEIPQGLDRESLIREIINEALGLGPLEDLIADPAVTEIMVNRFDQIYVERKGKLTLSDKTFTTNQAVLHAIERIVA
ncbi:MAG: FHA domain-containing protein, partial [Candidatus Binatia bacterium]